MLWWGVLVGALSGILGANSHLLNASLGKYIGIFRGSFLSHTVGALFAGVLLLVGLRSGKLFIHDLPFYYYLGGCLGVCSVAFINFSVPNIGIVTTMIVLTTFQLLTSTLIDLRGWFGATPITITSTKIIGLLLLMMGIYLSLGKRKQAG